MAAEHFNSLFLVYLSLRLIISFYNNSDGVWRGTKLLNVKKIVDDAIATCEKE
jgi:hypothetical protein